MLDTYLVIANSPLLWVFLTMVVAAFGIMWLTSLDVPFVPKPIKRGLNLKLINYVGALAIIFSIIFTALFLQELLSLISTFPDADSNVEEVRFHTSLVLAAFAAVGGTITLLFGFLKINTTERQTIAAENQIEHNRKILLSQRIQEAYSLLSARAPSARLGRNITYKENGCPSSTLQWQDEDHSINPEWESTKVGEWKTFTQYEPDYQTRISGISLLEVIAIESPQERRTINELMANFIRVNAPVETAMSISLPSDFWNKSQSAIRDLWTSDLCPQVKKLRPKPDIQTAIRLIGQSKTLEDTKDLNLKRTNLQGADLEGLHLNGVDLSLSKLDGADFRQTKIRSSCLQGSHFIGVEFSGAELIEADLSYALCHWAGFGNAKLNGARLYQTDLRSAQFHWAELGGTYFEGIRIDAGDFFKTSTLDGAAFRDLHSIDSYIPFEKLSRIFADGSCSLNFQTNEECKPRPRNWPVDILCEKDFDTKWRAFQRSIDHDPT